jgi:hypothetical protein
MLIAEAAYGRAFLYVRASGVSRFRQIKQFLLATNLTTLQRQTVVT